MGSKSRLLVWAVIVLLLLAVVGSVVHPLATLMSIVFPRNNGAVLVLNQLKNFFADLIFWAIFVILIFGVMVLLFHPSMHRRDLLSLADDPAREYVMSNVVVVMTAFNDVEAIRRSVPDFRSSKWVTHLILVDNNSTDDTGEVAHQLGALVVRESKQGYGHACIKGLSEALRIANEGVVILVEGDATFSARDIPKFLAYIQDVDMVVGTRTQSVLVDHDSQMNVFFVWGNMFLGWLLSLRAWELHFISRNRFTDVGCTYKAIKMNSLKKILPDLKDGGDTFSVHMLIVALARGLKVVEIPITFHKRIGQSKGASRSMWVGLRVGLSMLWKILTYEPKDSSEVSK